VRRSGLPACRNNGIKVMTVMYTRASTGHQRNENLGEEDSASGTIVMAESIRDNAIQMRDNFVR